MFESSRRERHRESEKLQILGIGLLVGAALGAASALLLAPASGEETRRALAKRARKAYAQGSELLEDSWDDAARAARRAARVGMKRARRQAATLRELGEETVASGRQRLRDLGEDAIENGRKRLRI
jgi:gas vesicle protein